MELLFKIFCAVVGCGVVYGTLWLVKKGQHEKKAQVCIKFALPILIVSICMEHFTGIADYEYVVFLTVISVIFFRDYIRRIFGEK